MTNQEQIKEIARAIFELYKNGSCLIDEPLCDSLCEVYNIVFEKIDEFYKETLREIFQQVMDICAFVRDEVKELAQEYGVDADKYISL